MKLNTELSDYQRLEQVKKILDFKSWAEFSRFLGMKNSQIFTDIKNGKSHISIEMATKLCSYHPEISLDWFLTGDGEMLRTDNSIVQRTVNGDNLNNGSIKNTSSPEDAARYDRLISLLEKEHEERSRLLDIIETLTNRK